jgi:hypothetical protein
MSVSLALTNEQREVAWQRAYRHSLDAHSDLEVGWEADRWRALGAHGIAGLCEDLLDERRADDVSVPAEVTWRDLDLLWRHIPHTTAIGFWVRSGGLCLVAALRMSYWLGEPPDEAT